MPAYGFLNGLLVLCQALALAWPRLEGEARNPGASFASARSSPGHPTRILSVDTALVVDLLLSCTHFCCVGIADFGELTFTGDVTLGTTTSRRFGASPPKPTACGRAQLSNDSCAVEWARCDCLPRTALQHRQSLFSEQVFAFDTRRADSVVAKPSTLGSFRPTRAFLQRAVKPPGDAEVAP